MRVEQRIGRCDRLGQESGKIYIGSLASNGTIEQRILSRLYQRLNIFERALGDMELVLGEEISSFESDVFRLMLSPQQQEERLERTAQAIANIEQQRESISESSDLFLTGRQLLDRDQQEISEAESGFLSPYELADFVYASLVARFPQSIRKLRQGNAFEVSGGAEIGKALHGLLRSYPVSHHARTEILRFAKCLEESRVRVVFWGEAEEGDLAHIRHPLVLLARWLARKPLPDVPYCRGVSSAYVGKPTLLLWAVGSLEGYTQRVELLCAAVDCASGKAVGVSPDQAQEWLKALTALSDEGRLSCPDQEGMMRVGEHELLIQFASLTESFKTRNALLRDKAIQSIASYADRKLKWLDRQLARRDLRENIRNLYRGWHQRLESETHSKIADVERKGAVRSSLQVIGLMELLP